MHDNFIFDRYIFSFCRSDTGNDISSDPILREIMITICRTVSFFVNEYEYTFRLDDFTVNYNEIIDQLQAIGNGW